MQGDKTDADGGAVPLHEMAQAFSEALGQTVHANGIRPFLDEEGGVPVADATRKFQVDLPDGTAGFAIVSGPVNPDLVKRGARNIALTRVALSDAVARPVLPPVAQGRVRRLSFALWPFRPPLLSGGRITRKWRYLRHAPRICDWHIAFVGETLHPADPEVCLGALGGITEDPVLSEPIREAAHRAQTRLQAGDCRPVHCLQHGDFWVGNILLPAAGDTSPFFVIDWAGMTREGYPLVDLCRMLMSLRCSQGFTARQMAALQARVGCDREDLLASVLGSLGHLGRNLEYFPPEHFRRMAEDVFRFADRGLR